MPLTQAELGNRIKAIRESRGITQQQICDILQIPRSAIALIESGKREVSSLELDLIAKFLGRDIRDFLSESFSTKDPLVALFRASHESAHPQSLQKAFQKALQFSREFSNLEKLLGMHDNFSKCVCYPFHAPKKKWDAIKQGQMVADQERRRLNLGTAPIYDIEELLDAQGIRPLFLELEDDISGLTLNTTDMGSIIVVNSSHPPLRQRFSFAHEYAHVLMDRDLEGAVSRNDVDNLREVRANAFAAVFLIPEGGVKNFLGALGKGDDCKIFVNMADTLVEGRSPYPSPKIQIYEIVQMAHHFKVSYTMAVHRLRSIKMISDVEFDQLKSMENHDKAYEIAKLLSIQEKGEVAKHFKVYQRFLSLALEAYRRSLITKTKFTDLAHMISLTSSDVGALLEKSGISDENESLEILIPD